MLTRRLIPCLDVHNRRVTKGVKFQNNVELGDPVEMAVAYSDGGCDELVFYDITASAERRPIDISMVEDVAKAIRIPFSVGGGISTLEEKLNGSIFIRVHRSSIINLNAVKELNKYTKSYDVTMKNGDVVRVSRGYMDNIKKLMY